ncbi:flagellar biosynthetic protein FliO [Cytobacillus sp. FJAT-54145]|uniref:Flagellar biosynthetic protein FliO n=1 Tax=Cytobacillus spartinae TaxID=3299023 RepID=A0ABW6K4K4_9BACI
MQRLRRQIMVLLLVMIALLGFEIEAYAEQLNSVKDCIQHPEKCSENQINPADDSSEEQEGQTSNVGLNIWDFLKMIIATIFVVALLYFLLKFINKKSRLYKTSQLVENLGGTTLGANRSVQIIKVGNRVLIVGVGENIQLLKEIEDEEEALQIIQDHNNRLEQLVQPSDIVTRVIKRTKLTKTSNDSTGNTPFSSLFKNQLEEMSKGRKKLYEEMEKKGKDEQ